MTTSLEYIYGEVQTKLNSVAVARTCTTIDGLIINSSLYREPNARSKAEKKNQLLHTPY